MLSSRHGRKERKGITKLEKDGKAEGRGALIVLTLSAKGKRERGAIFVIV